MLCLRGGCLRFAASRRYENLPRRKQARAESCTQEHQNLVSKYGFSSTGFGSSHRQRLALKFAIDENLDNRIVRGLRRLHPELDAIRIQDTEIYEADDPIVLEWCAIEERILVSHDLRTIPNCYTLSIVFTKITFFLGLGVCFAHETTNCSSVDRNFAVDRLRRENLLQNRCRNRFDGSIEQKSWSTITSDHLPERHESQSGREDDLQYANQF